MEYDRWIGVKMNLGFADASTEKRNSTIISISFYV